MSKVRSSTQLVNEKSETEMKRPRIATPAITTIVEPLNSSKLGHEALDNSEIVSL